MPDVQPTIWVNLTTSAKWSRPPVGIVRVEQELFNGLKALYSPGQLKSCVWDGRNFIEWAFNSASPNSRDEHVAVEKKRENLSPPQVAYIVPILNFPQLLQAIAQIGLTLTPAKIRPWVNKFLLSIQPRVGRFLQKKVFKNSLSTASFSSTTLTEQSNGISPFRRGDVLVSVGLDWNETLYQHFYQLKEDHGIKVVTCCYDLIPIVFPQYCVGDVAKQFSAYFMDVAEGSDLILCISRQTQSDLKDFIDRTGSCRVKTSVFPLGDNVPASRGKVSDGIRRIVCNDFILFVSSIERRKNHDVLYKAYHILAREGKLDDMPIIIFVGMQGWGVADLISDINLDPLVANKIRILNHVTDAELGELYRSAKFCVYPSFYEGWGLPVGEALAMGKAVIASDQGSLPEVGGALVQYADPWSPRAWAEEMYRLASNPSELHAIEENIKSHYKKRSWNDSSRAVYMEINSILNG